MAGKEDVVTAEAPIKRWRGPGPVYGRLTHRNMEMETRPPAAHFDPRPPCPPPAALS